MRNWKEYIVEETAHHNGGRHRIYKFDNGYGASLIPEFRLINTSDDEYVEIQDPETQEMEMENFIKTIKGY